MLQQGVCPAAALCSWCMHMFVLLLSGVEFNSCSADGKAGVLLKGKKDERGKNVNQTSSAPPLEANVENLSWGSDFCSHTSDLSD